MHACPQNRALYFSGNACANPCATTSEIADVCLQAIPAPLRRLISDVRSGSIPHTLFFIISNSEGLTRIHHITPEASFSFEKKKKHL